MNSAESGVTLIMGGVAGATIMYFFLWAQARKIEALVPGGLKAWDSYDRSVGMKEDK